MEAHCPHGTFASSRKPGNYETLFFLMELSQHGLAPSCTYIWLSPRSLTQLSFQCSLSAARQHKSGQPTTAWKKSVGSRKIRESKSIFAKNGRLQMKEFRSTATHTWVFIYIYIYANRCVDTRTHTHAHTHTHMYVYIYMYIYMYIYIYKCNYNFIIHMHMHTYTIICIPHIKPYPEFLTLVPPLFLWV